MIILDKPYVSKLLEETIVKLKIPVLKNEMSENCKLKGEMNIIDSKKFIDEVKREKNPLIYTNSENSINWITNNLEFTNLSQNIEKFKDKFKFRELIKEMYPDFYFKEIDYKDIEKLDISKIKMPFIIKPTIGFFSFGVYKVNSISEWKDVLTKLKKEVKDIQDIYPIEVVNSNKFIIEENIEGEEFALDVYYDNQGKAVILNILKHIFSSGDDVNDRVYITSKEIIEEYHELFLDFLNKMGNLINIENFPMHIEFRVDNNKKIVPIEVNPMRFAGWCTTDIAYYAYGINTYEYFFDQKSPDWKEILKSKKDKVYSIVIADISKDIDVNEIEKIDYEKYNSYFKKVLELRKTDYIKHNVFAFLFAETKKEDFIEIENILKSDLKQFIKMKNQ